MPGPSDRLRELVARGRGVVVLTGAGMSAESGVPTFRGKDGFWENESLEELATPQGFSRDPARTWRWYDARRCQIAACAPNAAHRALAAFEARHPGTVVITQNIDGLHQAAGSRQVIELHGGIFRVRCVRHRTVLEDRRVPLPEIPPCCECGALLRPDVVWFGEMLPEEAISGAQDAARAASLFLVIGTSAVVYPAAALPALAADSGAMVVEINPEATPISGAMDEVIRGPASVILPDLLGIPG